MLHPRRQLEFVAEGGLGDGARVGVEIELTGPKTLAMTAGVFPRSEFCCMGKWAQLGNGSNLIPFASMANQSNEETSLIAAAVAWLRSALPPAWKVEVSNRQAIVDLTGQSERVDS